MSLREIDLTLIDLAGESLPMRCLELAKDNTDLHLLRLEGHCYRHEQGRPDSQALDFYLVHRSENRRMCLAEGCTTKKEVNSWLDASRSANPEFLWFNQKLEQLAGWGIEQLSNPVSDAEEYRFIRRISVARLRASAKQAVSSHEPI